MDLFYRKIQVVSKIIFLLSTSLLYRTISFLPFIINSHTRGIGPTMLVLDWLRGSRVKVFVSLCSYSTGSCMRSSKHMGAETFVKNNGERFIELWNMGWGINVWRIGLSEHMKEEEKNHIFRDFVFAYQFVWFTTAIMSLVFRSKDVSVSACLTCRQPYFQASSRILRCQQSSDTIDSKCYRVFDSDLFETLLPVTRHIVWK